MWLKSNVGVNVVWTNYYEVDKSAGEAHENAGQVVVAIFKNSLSKYISVVG